jgi:DNA-binding NarL/FixJ family response regulator
MPDLRDSSQNNAFSVTLVGYESHWLSTYAQALATHGKTNGYETNIHKISGNIDPAGFDRACIDALIQQGTTEANVFALYVPTANAPARGSSVFDRIRKVRHSIHCVLLTATSIDVNAYLTSRADLVLSSNDSLYDHMDAFLWLTRGFSVVPMEVLRRLIIGESQDTVHKCDELWRALTPACRDLVPLIAQSLTNKQIAAKLDKDHDTIKKQIETIYDHTDRLRMIMVAHYAKRNALERICKTIVQNGISVRA